MCTSDKSHWVPAISAHSNSGCFICDFFQDHSMHFVRIMPIRVNLDGKGKRTPSGRSRQFKDIKVGFYHMRVQACACIFLHMIKPCSFFSGFLVVYGSQRIAEPHIQKQAFNHKHCSFGLVKAFSLPGFQDVSLLIRHMQQYTPCRD